MANKEEKKAVKTKQMPDEIPEEAVDETGDFTDEVEEKAEPYGASVLRRLHEDSSILMKDYDNLIGPLEHEHVKEYLQSHLEGIEKHLSTVEKMFGKHYKDLPGLAGVMDDKDMTDDEAQEVAEDAENLAEEVVDETQDVEEKDMDTMDDPATSADSGKLEEPTPEEAMEGMEKSDEELEMEQKTLRNKYRKSIKVKKKNMDEDEEKETKNFDPMDEQQEEVNVTGAEKGLDDKERGHVSEASNFLKDIAQDNSRFDDEERMKAYHYHKTFEGIGQMEEAHDKLESNENEVPPAEFEPGAGAKGIKSNRSGGGIAWAVVAPGKKWWLYDLTGRIFHEFSTRKEAEDFARSRGLDVRTPGKAMPGTPEWEAEEMQEPEHQKCHPHRMKCKDASNFFGELSREKNFGNVHRQKSHGWHKELDEMLNGDEPVEEESKAIEEENNTFEPGEMGEKKIEEEDEEKDTVKTKHLRNIYLKQNKEMSELSKKMNQLAKQLTNGRV